MGNALHHAGAAGDALNGNGLLFHDLYCTSSAVHTDGIAVMDDLGCLPGAYHAGYVELPGHHCRMGQGTTSIRHQTRDLGERHHPCRVRHLAHQDLAGLHIVQLRGIGHQMGDALHHAGTAGNALHNGGGAGFSNFLLGHFRLEDLGIAPQGLIGLVVDLPLGGGAVPGTGMAAAGSFHFRTAGLDQLLDGVIGAAGAADLLILEHEDILGVVQDTGPDHGLADLDKGDPQVAVNALIDVEMMVGGDGGHAHAELQVMLQGLQLLGIGDLGIQLLNGRLLGLHAGIVLGVVVVIVVYISTDRLISGGGVLIPGLIDELVGVHGLEAVLRAVGLHHIQELFAAGNIGHLGHDGGVVGGGEEQLLQSGHAADLFLHLPQGLQRIPVAVGGRDVDLTDEHIVSSGSLGGVGEVRGGLELGQVDDPVDAEGLGLHVQHILHVNHDLRQALVLEVKVNDGVLHFLQPGNVHLVPAVQEGLGIDGHDLGVVIEHGAHLVRVLIGGNHGGVHIAADVLGNPGLADGGAEALIHVGAVAAPAAIHIPPAADVEIQRRNGVGAVQIIIEPHQALFLFIFPRNGKALVGEFRCKNLGSIAHNDLSL